MLTITLLGTAATMPLPDRALTAALAECGGHALLFDCGEGTQAAARRAGVNLMKLDAICLTHYHGDHIFGLPGLLQTLGCQGRERPLTLYGPEGLGEVWPALRTLTGPLPYPVRAVQLDTDPIDLTTLSSGWPAGAQLTPFRTRHRVPSRGYRLDLPRAGRFDPAKARALNVPVPAWKLLQRGQSIPLENGAVVAPADVLGPARRGLRFVFSGDTAPCPALEQAAAEADRSAAAQNAGADALEGQIAERRAALPYPRRADAQAALDKLEADRRTLRTGMDTAQRKLKQAEQTVAAAEAAVDALTAQQTAAQKELPARSAEELTAQQTALTAARETLRSREKQLSAQLLPNRKTAAQYRAAAEARQTLESRWQWVSALAATAGGTLTSKQKIKLEAYIQMNYLDRILRYANTRLMQMTAGQYELERIGAENQRSQSGLDLGVIDHYNGTRRSVKTLSGGESFKASLALALGLSDEVQSSAGGIRLDTLFLDEGFGSLDEESLELAIRVLSGLTEGDRLVGIISHVGALKDRIDRQVVVHKARTGGSTVELRV